MTASPVRTPHTSIDTRGQDRRKIGVGNPGLLSPPSDLLRPGGKRGEGKAKLSGQASECDETVVSVEGFGLFVLGIDDQGENSDFGSNGPGDGIPTEGGPELLAAMGLVHGKAAEPRDGDHRIAGQTLHQVLSLRQVGQGHASGGECVESRDGRRRHFQYHEACSRTPTYVLSDLLLKISIENFYATRKPGPAVGRAEYLDGVGPTH